MSLKTRLLLNILGIYISTVAIGVSLIFGLYGAALLNLLPLAFNVALFVANKRLAAERGGRIV